jgi:uncharacterized membrane protein (DUF2068 family)
MQTIFMILGTFSMIVGAVVIGFVALGATLVAVEYVARRLFKSRPLFRS